MPSAPSTFSYHSVVRCASPALPPAPSAIAGMPRAMGALASVDALVSSASWPSARLAAIARSDRKSTRLNSSHLVISYAVFCLKKKNDEPVAVPHLDAARPPRAPAVFLGLVGDHDAALGALGLEHPGEICYRHRAGRILAALPC